MSGSLITPKFWQDWLIRFPWPVHSKYLDGGFCFPRLSFGVQYGKNAAALDRLFRTPLAFWTSACVKFERHLRPTKYVRQMQQILKLFPEAYLLMPSPRNSLTNEPLIRNAGSTPEEVSLREEWYRQSGFGSCSKQWPARLTNHSDCKTCIWRLLDLDIPVTYVAQLSAWLPEHKMSRFIQINIHLTSAKNVVNNELLRKCPINKRQLEFAYA